MHPRTRRFPGRYNICVGEVLPEHSKTRHLSQSIIRKGWEIKAGCSFDELACDELAVLITVLTALADNGAVLHDGVIGILLVKPGPLLFEDAVQVKATLHCIQMARFSILKA